MEYLTVEEVAAKLKIESETVYRWLRSGKLKGTKLAESSWRISSEELAKFTRPEQFIVDVTTKK